MFVYLVYDDYNNDICNSADELSLALFEDLSTKWIDKL